MVWVSAVIRSGAGVSALLAAAALVFGCSAEDETPTYYEDVAPLLSENCVGCHRAGGIAPFVLTDYESVRNRAASIADATASRTMPPMPVNNDGDCNKYSNARWLSNREIELLERWADAGAPEGDADAPRKEPHLEPELEAPDAVISMAAEYTPAGTGAAHHDDYRCFVLPAPVSEEQFLTAFQVYPGDARVVHHVIVYQPSSDEQVEAAHLLDAAEEGDGYTCFGSSLVDASPFALWAPGVGRMDMPAGTGVPLAANRALVMQVHYNLENGAFPDRTSVGLKFAAEPVIPGQYWSVADTEMMLPPGRELVESSHTDDWGEPIDFKVHGALPHMHTLGRTLRVDAQANGEETCLVDVDRWDFHWQNAWWYQRPLDLKDVNALSISCGFDTRSRSETVTWGDSTSDEMCISYFYVTTQNAPTPEIDCANPDNPLLGSCLQQLLVGCYEPDVSASCSVSDDGVLTWPDGSKIVVSDDRQDLYGPGDTEPCISVQVLEDSAVISGDDEELLYTADEENVTITCADGSPVVASQFHMYEFSLCTGLGCIP
jgi:hypothetical protein